MPENMKLLSKELYGLGMEYEENCTTLQQNDNNSAIINLYSAT